jgi:hypothetical protein
VHVVCVVIFVLDVVFSLAYLRVLRQKPLT